MSVSPRRSQVSFSLFGHDGGGPLYSRSHERPPPAFVPSAFAYGFFRRRDPDFCLVAHWTWFARFRLPRTRRALAPWPWRTIFGLVRFVLPLVSPAIFGSETSSLEIPVLSHCGPRPFTDDPQPVSFPFSRLKKGISSPPDVDECRVPPRGAGRDPPRGSPGVAGERSTGTISIEDIFPHPSLWFGAKPPPRRPA